jgi:hypothetical protein
VAEHLKGELEVPQQTKRKLQQIWEKRRNMMDSPLHGAGYCLDPEFLSDSGLSADNKADACVQDLLAIMEKLIPNAADQDKARASYAAFRAREGLFGSDAATRDRSKWPAHQWWEMYGAGHPQLQQMAVRVLSQVISACSCERAWSAYDFIHNKRRNKLAPKRARDLVFAFTNMRMAEKMQLEAGEPFVGWDEEDEDEVAGDEQEEAGDKEAGNEAA